MKCAGGNCENPAAYVFHASDEVTPLCSWCLKDSLFEFVTSSAVITFGMRCRGTGLYEHAMHIYVL